MNGKPRPARIESVAAAPPASPIGGFVELDGEPHYRIAAFHRLAPFLISVPGDTDLWMYVASEGGLSAGRVDADGSLFPYVTVDRLHHAHHHTGPITVLHVASGDGEDQVWQPFAGSGANDPAIERYLYKNTTGNQVVFEEIHNGLSLAFRYRWAASDEFGWVRTCTLHNRDDAPARIRMLDGLRNILPWGAPLSLYQQSSNLVDAYKKSEIDADTGLGIFSLTSRITDRTEALEALRANTVWCCGLENARHHLSREAVSDFQAGKVVAREDVLNGARGNYLVTCAMELDAGEEARWYFVGDTGKDHVQVAALRDQLRDPAALPGRIEASLREANDSLRRNVASADGLQLTGRPESWCHHFANVLFNNMRGGVFEQNYEVPVDDFRGFLLVRNPKVAARHRSGLDSLTGTIPVDALLALARETGDPDFERLGYEYLPLYFSRRHGDPSRPWNQFSIRARDAAGERELGFEGNWRDIFQNWEALCTSFPRFLPSIVAKFVNASTVDGFNPYRITQDGVEWELQTEGDSWSNIGYWGDHQIIYLLKLLEALDRHDPTALVAMLGREVFSYVDVPYRIRAYEDLVRDPRSTIHFDAERDALIEARVEEHGTDGKLLTDGEGSVYHANLLEKLLVPVLSKLSNLIPDAGIWMNTQRPEWNDANNALGGGGVSVVTLCYLRRHLAFLNERLVRCAGEQYPVSTEVAGWFDRIEVTLKGARSLLDAPQLTASDRKAMMDELGSAFSDYRAGVYARGFSGKVDVAIDRIIGLNRLALQFIDWGIAANRRSDGLYHTYNQLAFAEDGKSVELVRLSEMLEGQVAVLSSGLLDPDEALALVGRLFESDLYHTGHQSFLLYPERELPGFLDKNVVPDARVEEIGLLGDLLAAGEHSIVARDVDGKCRFNGDLSDARDLDRVLSRLASQGEWSRAVECDRAVVLQLFDDVFGHDSYTGRSGVMYGYEGLGCVYWHMVAKLLLATQENYDRASSSTRAGLGEMYFRIRSGIGYEKTVAEFGAFPTDPYSHTPAGGGARQPGMTGQVKEEILSRRAELGIEVEGGSVSFRPSLLRPEELLEEPDVFRFFDVDGRSAAIDLPAGGLAFTFCQVPVIYQVATEKPGIALTLDDGGSLVLHGTALDEALSAELFSRSGRIRQIRVAIPDCRSTHH